MTPAVYDQTSVDIEAKSRNGASTAYGLRASGRILKFSGWLEAYGKGETAEGAPSPLRRRRRRRRQGATASRNGARRAAKDLLAEDAEAHRCPSSPRARRCTSSRRRASSPSRSSPSRRRATARPRSCASSRSAASGGRAPTPRSSARCRRATTSRRSTAARFRPTTLGKFVVDGLVKSELDFMDPAFTSKMEEELDEVEAGKEERVDLLKRFYKRFRAQLDKSKKRKRWNPEPEPTDEKCELDGGVMLKRWSKQRLVPGLRELPRVQEHARPRAGRHAHAAARDGDRLRQVRQGDGHPERSLRRVPVVHRLPGVQEREARAAGREVPEVRRRHHRDPLEEARRARRSTAARTTRTKRSSATSSSGRSRSPSRARTARAPFLVIGGTRAKPMIACANKECGRAGR